MLHELISGRPAFDGESTAAALSAILRDDPPPLRTLVPGTPRAVERCVTRCLDKDPARRYQHASDLKVALEDLRDDLETGERPAARPGVTPVPAAGGAWWKGVAVAAAALIIALSGFSAAFALRPVEGPRIPKLRPLITEATFVSVSAGGGEPAAVPLPAPQGNVSRDGTQRVSDACISPDGRTIAFVDRSETGVRLNALDLRTGEVKPVVPHGLPQPSALINGLELSPDGASLGMFTSNTALSLARGVWVVAWASQSARHLFADAPYLVASSRVSWMPDSRRVVISGRPLEGGSARVLIGDTQANTIAPLTQGKEEESDARVSPDGARIAFVSSRQGLDLIQFPIDGGPPEPLLATSRNEALPDMCGRDEPW